MGIGVDAWDGIEMGIGIWDREYRDGDSDRDREHVWGGGGGDRDGDKDGDVNICSPTTTQPSHISAREWQPSPIRL
jgi:hypothetical protein